MGSFSVTGHYRCGRCNVCQYTTNSKQVDLKLDKPWRQNRHTNCNSKNVIYLAACPCGLRYVGMTGRAVKLRIQEHLSNIRCKRNTTKMSSQCIEQKHTDKNMTWTVIEQVIRPMKNIENTLYEKKQRWIYKLPTYRELNHEIMWNTICLK